ncbi:T9SS type A sorting domain-containing protein [Halpernia sp.]|uniref:T9SS type A sorting domain-containing protein n=1 Tax=Halpernia sp. TaxID=2782209 RepID=UPI003A8EF074
MKKLFYFLFLGIAHTFNSQPGTLDISFGTGGTAEYNNSLVISKTEIQSDGKLLICGYTADISKAVIKRHNIDGSVDPTFNLQMNMPYLLNAAFGAKQQSDGKLVVFLIGTNDFNAGPFYFRLARLNSDGSEDNSFSTTTFPAAVDNEFGFFIGTDEKPAIYFGPNRTNTGEINIMKFLIDGNIDTSFGTNGTKQHFVYNNPPGEVSFGDYDRTLISDDSGNIYISFRIDNKSYIHKTNLDFSSSSVQENGIERIEQLLYHNQHLYVANTDGMTHNLQKISAATLMPVTSYGDNSIAKATGPNNMFTNREIRAIVQPDNKGIVIASVDSKMYVSRFKDDGNIDNTFGTGGTMSFNTSFDAAYNMSAHYSPATQKLYIINPDPIDNSPNYNLISINLGNTKLSTIETSEANLYKVYPNPVVDFINVPQNITEITLTDMSGKIVLNRLIKGEKINLSGISKGAYILVMKHKNGKSHQQKIIKN